MKKMAEIGRIAIDVVYTIADVLEDIVHDLCFAVVAGIYDGMEGYVSYQGDNEHNYYWSKLERKKRPNIAENLADIDPEKFSEFVESILKDRHNES